MNTIRAVELGVLGPLQVRQDGAPVVIPGAKPRAVLTMLGLHVGSVVSAEALVELLWGEDPPRTATKALQTHISSLRRALGDGFVLTEGTGWTLTESGIDASRYKAVARLGRDAVAVGDSSQAVACFEEALALWRGTPELPDGRRGTSEKTRWVEGHAALVEDRADALLATGRAAEIIGDLEAAVADAPLRERRWAQLMLALYRAGRQGEALSAYQRARALLADELGVDPGPDLRKLEAAIVAQEAALDVAAAQRLASVTRAVTFLLTDIEGSTAAWEAEADAMAVALARHDELVEQVVTSRGGRLIKTRGEGDATFSVFDRPSAAAAAALELQDAIVHEPWTLREPMRIRVALHTGEVELRDGDYFGRAVNRAARLRSLAEGGQILCSGATSELVIDSLPDDVVLADLGMRQLKNLARPEHVFELRLETAQESAQPPTSDAPMARPSLPSVLIGAGPFVGRGTELERLYAAWQTALGACANAVLIAGEPGVGKTRLASEWSRQAYEQGAVVLYGRCDEDLGAPYQPFAEALRSLVPCVGTNRLRGLRGVEALLPLVPGLIDDVPDIAAPTRADPDTERYALFDAVVALFGTASTEAPVVLVLDDLHWAAKPTLLLLRHLLRFGDHARLQIIGTYRSTDLDRAHPLAAMLADLHRDGTANRINLSGLDEDDVSAYVAKAGYDDEELGHALASVTGGNPFFLIEALRHVDESGGVWDPSTLPQGVREAVSRRLSRLPIETNKALAAAAVVGSRFALDLVERVLGDDLVDAFDEAAKAGIVIEEPGGRYQFNHAIIRQSLLAELPAVRRMRLHQRIATTLEDEPGSDDELLAELAHHYFECAWAGNAAKAVEYCRRAANQAMARLAYEGAAELYDHALHAFEELDDELPDRDDQVADLLVARCEALLAAGDVASAAGAVSQLQQATVDSARLAAWTTCFDGQLSILIHPERLDDVEAALGAAAHKLAEIDDAAGEAKAHTVRATCLARLGRIGDCEIALDDALTAARRARDHRRVNAVLAGAPLAALWGPNPVPRAGGRCLDVVRLLRITTDSPAVEATSTRCQAVLEAFRGRDAAARRMIESARRTVTELGLRHALLEVEQFAGIVELVLGDPAAAEPHLRQAYNGFRRMGLDADTAETAALLGRACLALNRDAEADELCTESERLAGHALKPAIAWRTLRAQLLSRGNDHEEARRVAQAAIALAEHTDALVDHGDACLALATVLRASGDAAGARAAADRAAGLYEQKGAAALADKARRIFGGRELLSPPTLPEKQIDDPDNACVRAIRRAVGAANREDWGEVEQVLGQNVNVESRRKIITFTQADGVSGGWTQELRRLSSEIGEIRYGLTVVAIRGERLALVRLVVGTADASLGAPESEMLQVYGIDTEGLLALHVWFDVDDIDAAMAELDAAHARFEAAHPQIPHLDNACVRAIGRLWDAYDREAWDEVEAQFASEIAAEHRRKIVGFSPTVLKPSDWARRIRHLRATTGAVRHSRAVVAVRGDRLALTRFEIGTADTSPGAPQDELLHLFGLDNDGRIALFAVFDIEDLDAALTELDAAHARFEDEHQPARRLENAASHAYGRFQAYFAARDWDAMAAMLADNSSMDDRRQVVGAGVRRGRGATMTAWRAIADIGVTTITSVAIAIRGTRLALCRSWAGTSGAFDTEALQIVDIDDDERMVAVVSFGLDEFDAALKELDARYLAGEAAAHAQTWSVVAASYVALNRHELPLTAPDCVNIDHRRETAFGPGDLAEYIRTGLDLAQGITIYVEKVHQLNNLAAGVTYAAHETSQQGFNAEWRGIALFTVDGDLINRCEIFDEAEIDAAIARFDQLTHPAPRLENAASQAFQRVEAYIAARDWDSVAEIAAENFSVDDRRRVVNAGIRYGRDAAIRESQSIADVGFALTTVGVMVTRGARLALVRVRASASDPEAILSDAPNLVEIDADGRIVAIVIFDLDDFDAAIAELDARYLAGEAAAYAPTWSVVAGAYAGFNRREPLATTPDWVNIDHRCGAAFAPGEMIAYLQAAWDDSPDTKIYIGAVHRLSKIGAVVTHLARGISQEGFDAEWRDVHVLAVEGDMLSRSELFDEGDLDAAIARFDQLGRPGPWLENMASRANARLIAHVNAREWDSAASILADDHYSDDRRRVTGAGTRRGRDADIENFRVVADLEANITVEVIATRGDRLILTRNRVELGETRQPFVAEFLGVVETDLEGRIAAVIELDLEDFDVAFAELDARYLAGEAAANSCTWSLVAASYTALNRQELPLTTPDCVNIDHRRKKAFGPSDLIPYLRAGSDRDQEINIYVEAVHRLTGPGAVVTYAAHETSREGFDAEWRGIAVFTVEGDMINRTEVFDEAALDGAIARSDQLSRPAHQLENTASRVDKRFQVCFTAQDWDALAELLSGDFSIEDRRRVVNMGNSHGRDAELTVHAYGTPETENVKTTVTATRAQRLALTHYRFSGSDQRPDAFRIELLAVVEIDADERMAAVVVFDADEIDAAIAELDARYLAGEAAPHSAMWSAVMENYVALNRHELPLMTPDVVSVDHRRGRAFAPGDLPAYLEASWELMPQSSLYIADVHRLNDIGAVVTHVVHGTTAEGFAAEWREIIVLQGAGDRMSRCEMFDEEDFDAAIARFGELRVRTTQLENAATRVSDHYLETQMVRDWDAMAEMLADNYQADDRRQVVGGKVYGRDAAIANARASADVGVGVGVADITATVIATRGENLALSRFRYSGRDQELETFVVEILVVGEINADGRVAATVAFDVDEIDAAFAELDARYLAGEAAPHSVMWSAVMQGYAALNRHELPLMTPDAVSVDHRRGRGFTPGDLAAYLYASWGLTPQNCFYIDAVHRLSNASALVTHVLHGSTHDGFDAEWREIALLEFAGDRNSRCEMFDEEDFDAALARFEELSRPTPRLENAASQVTERYWKHFADRDWAKMAELVARDISTEDRRRVVNAGIRHGRDDHMADMRSIAEVLPDADITTVVMATRGARLILTHIRILSRAMEAEVLRIDEVDADNRIVSGIAFDIDDIGAAIAELEAWYLTGEAAGHADTWSLIAQAYTVVNRHELPPTTPDWVNIDHRRGRAFAPGDLKAYLHATWVLAPDVTVFVEAVHRLSNLGGVITHCAHRSSQEGFDAEWREVILLAFDAGRVNHFEVFDETDLDAALARFDELDRQASAFENAATATWERLVKAYNRRDVDGFLALTTQDGRSEDRRKGLRHIAVGLEWQKTTRAWLDAPRSWRMDVEILAIRGSRLSLSRNRCRDTEEADQPVTAEILAVTEVNEDGLVREAVSFDPDDIDEAFAELTARWIASGEVAHPEVIESAQRILEPMNRHDWDAFAALSAVAAHVNHRQLSSPGVETIADHMSSIRAMASLVPDVSFQPAEVLMHSATGLVTQVVIRGTSTDGMAIEIPVVTLHLFDAGRLTRLETFDADQRDAALARFEELTGPDLPPRGL